MRRLVSVLLLLGLVGCRPGQPSGLEDDASFGEASADGADAGDGDGDGDELSVLFIGNSYTYKNRMPDMVEDMAAAASIPVTIEVWVHGGYYVASHLQHPETAALLAQGFDVVVINGEPFEPVLQYPVFEYGVQEIVNMAGDARVVLYQTWPRRFDSPDLIEHDLTVEEMWAGLELGYYQVAVTVDAELATVGAAWMSALELEPPIELYDDDANHPSYAGSYLAACVLFGVIFDETCTTNGWEPESLAPEDRERLQLIADITNGTLDP